MRIKNILEELYLYNDRLKKFLNDKVFLATVLIPTLISVIYFGMIASDIYISESRFIIRSPSSDNISSVSSAIGGTGVTGLLGKFGLSNSETDSFAAESYIQSRDALNHLNQKLDLRNAYLDPSIDRLNRFAGIRIWDKSLEAFFEYYLNNIIGISHDPVSGISTLSIRAFKPELAFQTNLQLTKQSEDLINRLNERARQDMLQFAQKEVELARNKVESAGKKLHQYRTQKQTGTADQQVIQFQQIANEKDFADRNLAGALASLEQARIEALKKQLYLERVAEPNKPDMAMEPRRIRGIVTTFVLGLLVWGILLMIIAGIKEHHQS